MVVQCPKCGSKKKIKVNEELAGKRISFVCKTEGCHEKIMVKIPSVSSSQGSRKTVVLSTGTKNAMASLIHIDEDGNDVKTYKIKKGTNIIGRHSSSPKANIAIEAEDRFMSRTHCTITTASLSNSIHFIIKDYQSKNDTYINGHILGENEEIYLQNDDIIQLGKTKLKIQITQ